MGKKLSDLIGCVSTGEIWDIWPDYPCIRCRRMIEGTGEVCRCQKWRYWFARVWLTFYAGGEEK
jgi:hypothetical protein